MNELINELKAYLKECENKFYNMKNKSEKTYFQGKCDGARRVYDELLNYAYGMDCSGPWYQEANRQSQPKIDLLDMECHYPNCKNDPRYYVPSNKRDFEERVEITCLDHENYLGWLIEDIK